MLPAVAQRKGASNSLNAAGVKVNRQATCQASPLLCRQASLSGRSGPQHTIRCGLLKHKCPVVIQCVAADLLAQCVRPDLLIMHQPVSCMASCSSTTPQRPLSPNL